jgi:UDP-GlcNAc:undecaprenyl-phosphate/decaprenyl-phosphate GlcNAc-1-phosphate transferase
VIALVALAAGAASAALLWWCLWRTLATADVLERTNLRGRSLPVASGIVVVLAVVGATTLYRLVERFGGVSPSEAQRGETLGTLAATTLGFAFLGLVDDLVGAVATKGFGGHLRALAHGDLTTGVVKLAWGGLVGLLTAAALVPGGGFGAMLRGGLLVAATANLANLLDRAPGRAIKATAAGAVLVAALGAPGWALTGPLLVVGAGLGLLVADLRERCMLGDTGANPLGAAVGAGLVLSLGAVGQTVAVVVVMALNLLSERVSFTRVIDRTPPLRWLDRIGTLPERRHAP